MNQHLDDRTLNILYHALGADPDEGLPGFDVAFREAESDFRLDDLDVLLRLISDPTLQDRRLQSWYQYYSARKSLILWELDRVEQILDRVDIPDPQDEARLQPRIDLLHGQVQLLRGFWQASRETIEKGIGRIRPLGEPTLLVDAYEAIAQAYVSQAHSSGDWQHPRAGRFLRLWRGVLTVTLLPLYALVLIYLRLSDALPLWRPALRFGADYSNWPIFQYYLRAYQALAKARRMSDQVDEKRQFRLELMWAGLLRDLTAYRSATVAYETLLTGWARQLNAYEKASIYHGLARTILEMGSDDLEDPLEKLETARETYTALKDERAVAYVDLLLGDIDLANGVTESALEKWEASVQTFCRQKDLIGLAEGLGRCYAVLEEDFPEAVKGGATRITRAVGRQVFTVRMPNRLFRVIQVLGWMMPLLIWLVLIVIGAVYMGLLSRDEYRAFVLTVLSWRGIAAFGSVLFAGMVANTSFGVIGLLSALRAEPTRLDLFELNGEGVSRLDPVGGEAERILWSSVDLYLRVERALFFKPTGVLSFDYLHSRDSRAMRLPRTTLWYKHLRQAVEERLECSPQSHRLQWHGGAVLVYLGIVYILTFLLTDSFLHPWLSVAGHARVAVALQVVSFLFITYVISRWIVHYISVNSRILSVPRFVIGTCLLGVFLVGLGSFGRRILFPVSSFVVAGGTISLVGLMGHLGNFGQTRRKRLLARVVQGVALIGGVLLVLHSLVPVLYHTQVYTYAGALQNLDPNHPGYAGERADYFQRMRRAGKGVVTWDSMYGQGYAALGLAEYFFGDYRASVDAYSRSMALGGSAEYYYCRALAYHALGDEANAEQDIQAYLEKRETDDGPRCQRYFPEIEGILPLP